MFKSQKGSTSADLLFIVLWLAVIGGWIANIVKLVGMVGGEVTTMFILRAVGIFAAPLGAVLGYL